jgi:hypothetical protein
MARSPAGRTASELADDLFCDPSRVVAVHAELSRLRRTLGPLLEARPYRLAASVRTTVLVPGDGPDGSGSRAPVAVSD